MKKLFILTALAVAFVAKAAFAADFPITAIIPAATTVKFVVSEVTPGNPPKFDEHPGNHLNFSEPGKGMTYDTDNGIWVGSRFFAIDLAPMNGENPAPGNYGSIAFSYAGNVVPPGQAIDDGLNKRATLVAVRVNSNQSETELLKGAIGNAFANLNNADVDGGYLRVYVGLSTGEINEDNGLPLVPGSQPFTNADKPGTYTGTLTITATLL